MAGRTASARAPSGQEPAVPPEADNATGDRSGVTSRTEDDETTADEQRADQARLGAVVNGFRLVELLGRGGAASVYRSVHEDGRVAAIKVLHPEHTADARARKRLLREAYLANRIGHPGVARVLGDGVTDDGAAYLVLELCEGETLQQRRKDAAGADLSIEDVSRWMDELLDVLAVAHERGIVHRDIKPGNLLVMRDGHLKVLDFGIARVTAVSDAPSLVTRTGAVLGTPQFMPPEQALGRSENIDARSDIWSVGATMFTLLTGRYVHPARNVNEAIVLAATQKAPKVRSVRADLPAGVAAVVDRALAFDQGARFVSAHEMQEALRWAMRGEEIEARKDASIETLPEESAPVRRVRAEVGSDDEGSEDGDFEFRPRKWWLYVLAVIAIVGMFLAGIRGSGIPPTAQASAEASVAEPPVASASAALPPPVLSAGLLEMQAPPTQPTQTRAAKPNPTVRTMPPTASAPAAQPTSTRQDEPRQTPAPSVPSVAPPPDRPAREGFF